MHYSVSDVSSSSTPITPDRFEYWPAGSIDSNSPQQSTFQFGHSDKASSMLPTLPEFDGESNLGELRGWAAETHADDQPVIMAEQQNALAL
jgi:hypothetical protein